MTPITPCNIVQSEHKLALMPILVLITGGWHKTFQFLRAPESANGSNNCTSLIRAVLHVRDSDRNQAHVKTDYARISSLVCAFAGKNYKKRALNIYSFNRWRLLWYMRVHLLVIRWCNTDFLSLSYLRMPMKI